MHPFHFLQVMMKFICLELLEVIYLTFQQVMIYHLYLAASFFNKFSWRKHENSQRLLFHLMFKDSCSFVVVTG
jgi:hypothetical protein